MKRDKGKLPMKKVVARKMGISRDELNRRFFKKDDRGAEKSSGIDDAGNAGS